MQERVMFAGAFALDAGRQAAEALWKSVKALWTATAVWLAVAVLFVGGFVLGHIEASQGKREIRDRMRAAEARTAAVALERDLAVADKLRIMAEVADLKKRMAEVADLKKRMAEAAESPKKRKSP